MTYRQLISRHARPVSIATLTCAALIGLAGCGGDSGSSSASSSAAASASPSAGQGPGGGRNPGVSGVISGTGDGTVTVTDSQGSASTVKYTSDTSITKQTSAAASIVATGACVSVRQQFSGGQPSGAPTGAPTGQGGDGAPQGMPTMDYSQPIAATSVIAMPAASCDGTGGMLGFGGLTGKITGTGSGTFTMQAQVFSGGMPSGSPSAATATQTPSSTPTTVTVTVSADTTYAQQATAGSDALSAGLCVTAQGQTTDDTLTARSMVVSTSDNGTCDTGFGGMGRG